MDNESNTLNDGSDILKILVATDNHLGYEESDPIIGNDSFIAFEEILQLAVDRHVDMILLGGDLFHDNNPSQQTFNRCMALLRKYTLGNKEIYLELYSHEAIESSVEGAAPVNYMDQNLNVAIPVFSIHGNHDDPSGAGLCSAMDTLSSAGLINYFGKKTNLEHIEVPPILLKKGSTRLALYGLSHIKDERLCRMFLQEKVLLMRPKENTNDWFNLFVLHQNRADRGAKRFISESYLPEFLDLIVWGHEHDCDIVPQQNLDKKFYVTQPGSSVPTSLSEGETKPKHVALLKIYNRKFLLEPIKLKTCRPFVFESIKLKDIPVTSEIRQKKSEDIRLFCVKKVEQMIRDAKDLESGHPQQPTLPLIRLRCEYTDDTQLFNTVKFGQQFYKRVANPDTEIVRMKKLAKGRDKTANQDAFDDLNNLRQLNEEEPETFGACVESIVEEYFETFADKKMLVLSVKGMAEAVKQVIEKGDPGAIEVVCKHQREHTLKKLLKMDDLTEENITQRLQLLRDERANDAKDAEEIAQQLHDAFVSRGSDATEDAGGSNGLDDAGEEEQEGSHDDDMDYDVPVVAARGRRGRGTGARGGKRGAAGKQTIVTLDDDDEDEAPLVIAQPAPRARGRGRGSRGGRAASKAPARGGRGSRGKAATSITNFLVSQTPSARNTPVRMAARSSQMSFSGISYDDYDDSD